MKFEVDKKGLLLLREGWVWQEPKDYIFAPDTICNVFAITLPIAEPLNMDWKDVDARLNELFHQNDLFHNWALTTLFKHEPIRTRLDEKYVSPSKDSYNELQKKVYNDARKLFPLIPSPVVASTLKNKITKLFNKKKLLVFLGRENQPYYKEGQPLEIPSSACDIKVLNTCGSISYVLEIIISCGKSNNRIQLRLAGGDNFGREHGNLKAIMEGTAKWGACALVRERVGGVHHHTETLRDDNKNKYKSAYKVKIVVKQPRPTLDKNNNKTMYVETQPDTFFTIWVGGKKFQTYNADNINRWIEEEKITFSKVLTSEAVKKMYPSVPNNKISELQRILSDDYGVYLSSQRREYLNSFSQDRKCEYRAGSAPSFNSKSARIAENYERRTDSFIKQVAAMLCNHAIRNHCDMLVLNTSKGLKLAGEFPWFKMKTVLQQCVESKGIKFEPVCSTEELKKK